LTEVLVIGPKFADAPKFSPTGILNCG